MSALPPVGASSKGGQVVLGGEGLVSLLDRAKKENPNLSTPNPRYGQLTRGFEQVRVPGVFVAQADPNANQGIYPAMVLPKAWEDRLPQLRAGKYYIFKTKMEGAILPRLTAVWYVHAPIEDVEATADDLNGYSEFLPQFSFSQGKRIDAETVEHQFQLDQSVIGKWDGFQATCMITTKENPDVVIQKTIRRIAGEVESRAADKNKNFLRLDQNNVSWTFFKDKDGEGTIVYYEIHPIPSMRQIADLPGLTDAATWVISNASGPITDLTTNTLDKTVKYFASRVLQEDWIRDQQLLPQASKYVRASEEECPEFQPRASLK